MNSLRENNSSKQIRFGIMCNDFFLKTWELDTIKHILKLNYAKLELIILNENKQGKLLPFTKRKKLFYKLFWKIFVSNSATFRRKNCTALFRNIKTLKCKTIIGENFYESFCKENIEKINSYRLDFILKFGFGRIRGKILNSAKYGVWSFRHDDDEKHRGCPPCFWEIFYDKTVIHIILQKLTERLNGGIFIKNGYFKTINYSYIKSVQPVYLECSRWPAQVCIDIINKNIEYFTERSLKIEAPRFKSPKNGQMILFLFKLVKNGIKNVVKDLFFHDIWNVGLINEPIQSFFKKNFKPKIMWLPKPKKDEFYSDPFGININNNEYILCERFYYKYHRGDISFFEKTKNYYSIPKTIISESYPLSYPFIIEEENNIYCIPESCKINKVILYKALEFPNKWIKNNVLIDKFKAEDPTIFRYEGNWWLTCSTINSVSSTTLYLFYSESLFGPWIEHPLNPVKTDITSSRPAGTPFLYKGKLIRPAQDCSKTYGYRITLNEIIELTPTNFKERKIKIFELDINEKYNKGIHTISSFGNMTLIDGKKYGFRKDFFRNYCSHLKTLTKNMVSKIFKIRINF